MGEELQLVDVPEDLAILGYLLSFIEKLDIGFILLALLRISVSKARL